MIAAIVHIAATVDGYCHSRLLLPLPPSPMIPGTVNENISDFQNSEIPPLCIHQLQLAFVVMVFLDLFKALNRTVVSIWP